MFNKILIANRGEIACRVMATAKRLGIRCVAVYSDADRDALHVEQADEAYRLGPAPVTDSYLRIDKIIEAAKASGAQAIHPGYGFLSENPDFVEACDATGITLIGPSAAAIHAMGLKDAAKQLMEETGVPVVPGYHGDEQESTFLASCAADIGYPVLIKARAGGGGKGMRRVDDPADFASALDSARREAESSFGDGQVLIEKYVATPRHIEVQVFGDSHGNVVHLFERDCSLQRRHQKVIEEAPAPGMNEDMRQIMGEAAVRAAQAVDYVGAGTVEFIVDASDGLRQDRFYFMEMNTRLQVEHPVTELITGLDLVEWQLRVASGEPLPFAQTDLSINGHAFEARLYAEDAEKGFLPATGRLTHLHLPSERARIDTGVRSGDEISPFYDPMIAKLIVHGPNRAAALNAFSAALAESQVAGCVTNIGFLARLAQHDGFAQGDVDTGLIERDLDSLIVALNPSDEVLSIAALAALGLLSKIDSDPDPWNTLSGWRLWNEATQFAHLNWRDTYHEIAVVSRANGKHSIERDGKTLATNVLAISGNDVRLDLDGRIIKATVLSETAAVTVFYAGQHYRFALPDHLAEIDEAGVGEDRVIAPMPGQIVAVNTANGKTVKQGDALIVMEAMKMEHTLTAPRDGVVAELSVVVGEQVAEGTVMLILEE